jgi:hypothetical protein
MLFKVKVVGMVTSKKHHFGVRSVFGQVALRPNRALQATVTSGLRPLAPGPEHNR